MKSHWLDLGLLVLLLKFSLVLSQSQTPCSTRTGSQFCLLSSRGDLSISCAPGAVALLLKFQDNATSWPSESGRGLRDCGSILQLKITGWGGPELQSGHTAQLPGLRKLEIQDGAVQRLGDNVCRRVLLELVLVRNRISELNPEALSECDSLELLDLSDNRIGALPDRFLAACTKLRVLKLSGNRLEELGPLALQGAPSLFELHAPRNRFPTLSSLERAFESNRQLSIIDLRHNVLFAYLPSSADGLCGPDNVTVLLHFAGCAPSTADSSVCREARRHRCLGSSAHLVVTFTSCQVTLATQCAAKPLEATNIAVARAEDVPSAQRATTKTTAPGAAAAVTTTAAKAQPEATAATCPSQGTAPLQADCRLFTRLSAAAASGSTSDPAVWLLIALGCTVLFALLLLLVSLAVCHRLKIRLARLQERYEQLSRECSSHQSFCHNHHRPSIMCSRLSGLSCGRRTPSGRGPSSQCGGFSDCGDFSLPMPLKQQQQQQQPLLNHQQQQQQQQLEPIDSVSNVIAGCNENNLE